MTYITKEMNVCCFKPLFVVICYNSHGKPRVRKILLSSQSLKKPESPLGKAERFTITLTWKSLNPTYLGKYSILFRAGKLRPIIIVYPTRDSFFLSCIKPKYIGEGTLWEAIRGPASPFPGLCPHCGQRQLAITSSFQPVGRRKNDRYNKYNSSLWKCPHITLTHTPLARIWSHGHTSKEVRPCIPVPA